MSKRHSQDLSASPESTPAVDGDTGASASAPNPPKRLKTAGGLAAAVSPYSARDGALENEDEAIKDSLVEGEDDVDGDADAENGQRRSKLRAEPDMGDDATTEDAEGANADADVVEDADATIVSHEPQQPHPAVPPQQRTVKHPPYHVQQTANGGRNNANTLNELLETMSDISEDTDSEVPMPRKGDYHHLSAEEINMYEQQVTICAWDGCTTGSLGSMDHLVEHLHAEHVEGKQRRYTCEWVGCARKGKSHASAYALKAHLRSHTREKPHVCLLPECDQAFARQDALNKHMRTTHDIDLMRSIETAPATDPWSSKSAIALYGGVNGMDMVGSTLNGTAGAAAVINGKSSATSKLKIIIKTPQSHATGRDDSIDTNASGSQLPFPSQAQQQSGFTFVNEVGVAGTDTVLTRDQGFSARELEMPLDKLYGLCRCQLRWAEEENAVLRRECAVWESTYYQAWLEKQVLLDQVVQSEKAWLDRRKTVLASLAAEEAVQRAVADALDEPEGEDDYNDDDGADDDEDAAAVTGTAVSAVIGGASGDVDDDDDDDDDADDDMTGMDLEATQDDMSFADNTSFVGSSLRNEVAVHGH